MSENQPERLSQADYEVLANFRFALRQFTAFSTRAAQAAGLPPQQHQALLAIKGHAEAEAMTIGVLAERLLIAPQTATELVNRLAEAGLAERVADPHDRRRHALALSAKAEALLNSMTLVHLRELQQLAPSLVELLQVLDRAD
ncbi:MarR family winged helix-turn-helix transcriptional regulator [Devosia sp. Root635]|uniref:MarR family winged helix-turn-helix transcriptional regulator n=1 Tax=Devosia sp. Root635 TaxID=1736575 RepID=UPI000701F5F0|nr:helix-turn-helix domain-containing protein [Devosia sp. Root635]KRA53056.1 MarR family transcriptional regulator [Devosia sp. Root635]